MMNEYFSFLRVHPLVVLFKYVLVPKGDLADLTPWMNHCVRLFVVSSNKVLLSFLYSFFYLFTIKINSANSAPVI